MTYPTRLLIAANLAEISGHHYFAAALIKLYRETQKQTQTKKK